VTTAKTKGSCGLDDSSSADGSNVAKTLGPENCHEEQMSSPGRDAGAAATGRLGGRKRGKSGVEGGLNYDWSAAQPGVSPSVTHGPVRLVRGGKNS
jgi:hypothetical protein